MGSRNLERISILESRPGCETVEAMINANWRVRAQCTVCRLERAVDLRLVESTRGPEMSLWGRDAHCRRPKCLGRMWFYANAPWMRDPRRFDYLSGAQPEKREPAYRRGQAPED